MASAGRRAGYLGLAAGVIQSADFVRERWLSLSPGLITAVSMLVLTSTVVLWAATGLRSGGLVAGALAGVRSAAVTTATLWAVMALVARPLAASLPYALGHAVAFLGFGLLCGGIGAGLPALRSWLRRQAR